MGAAAAAVAGPQLAVDLANYAFPDTVEGIAVAHTFTLTNSGNQELVIESARPGCECVSVQLAKSRLQPGESIGLYALLDTQNLSGKTTRSITVTSNDPGPYGDYKRNLSLVGVILARQPYQRSVGEAFGSRLLLLDVRSPGDYAAGHLVGALNVPENQVASLAATLPAGTRVVFYDQQGASATQRAVAQSLHGGGLDDVWAVRGGFATWQKEYGAQRLMAGSEATWQFLDLSGARAYTSSSSYGVYDVNQLASDAVWIDMRSAAAFAAGHLVGALNLAESSIQAFIETLPRSTPVVVYSDDGRDSDRVVESLWRRGSRAKSLLGGLAEWRKQHGDELIIQSSS